MALLFRATRASTPSSAFAAGAALALVTLLLPAEPSVARQLAPLVNPEVPITPTSSPTRLRFQHFDQSDGLSQANVYTVFQDRQGFMWFGTQEGLDRFDGREFKNYRWAPFDTTSLGAGWVQAVTEDQDGNLWVGRTLGLSKMDRKTGRFVHYAHDPADSTSIISGNINDVLSDRDGKIWVATGRGLSRLDPQTGKAVQYPLDPSNPRGLRAGILDLFEDLEGRLWLGTWGGLQRYVPSSHDFEHHLDETMEIVDGDTVEVAAQILEDRARPGVLWIAGSAGLTRYDVASGTHESFRPQGSERFEFAMPSLTFDPSTSDVLWAHSVGSGLLRFHIPTGHFTRFQHSPRNAHSLGSDFFGPLLTDTFGNIWKGSNGTAGIDKFDPAAIGVTTYQHDQENPQSLGPGPVWGILEDRSGTLWVGSAGGPNLVFLNRVDRATERVKRIPIRARGPGEPGMPRHIIEADDGTLWMATHFGIASLDPLTEDAQTFRHDPADPSSLPNNNTWFVHRDRSGQLWTGTSGGLAKMDPLQPGRFTTFKSDPADSLSLSGDFVRGVVEDPLGELWFATNRGVSRMDPNREGVFTRYQADPKDPSRLSGNQAEALAVSSKDPNGIWVGTIGAGLNRIDRRTGEIRHYTEADGLSSNTIYCILDDEDGYLWISTVNGLSRFDPETGGFRVFGMQDGLTHNEFDGGSCSKSRSGELFFGTINGVNAFYPHLLVGNSTPPAIVLTEFRIANQPVEPGPDSPLKAPLAETGEIRLSYDQRDLSFSFVALHYKDSERNRYAYRLEGYDPDWIDAGEDGRATYTNLEPGDYVFRVRAANSDGVWNEEGVAVRILISPPIWATWWFRTLALVGFVSLLFGGYRARVSRIEARTRELEAAVAERTSQLARKNDQLEQSHAIVAAINGESSFTRLLEKILEESRAIPGVEKASALVYDDLHDVFLFRASRGWSAADLEPIRLTREEAEARYVTGAEQVAEDVFVSSKASERPLSDRLAALTPASFLVLRVRVGESVAGYLVFDNMSDPNAFDRRDVDLLERLHEHIRSAFIKTRLLDDLRTRNLEISARRAELERTIEDLRRTQDQLVEQEKLASLGQLTAGIAHEIKNPLNFVNNFAALNAELVAELREALSRGENGDDLLDDMAQNAAQIEKHGRRADDIVRAMMLHASGARGEREPTGVNELVGEYANLAYHGMRANLEGFQVDFRQELDPESGEAPLVRADIGRVLLNLMTNAFQAVHERQQQAPEAFQARVTVRTRRAAGWVDIEVEDNGGGIPEEVRRRVFEPFFTTKPSGTGTGLGLSLSNEIVAKGHGGSIELETELGKGSRFVVRLPAVA